VKNLARFLQMNCRADSQTMTDVHIGCDYPDSILQAMCLEMTTVLV
jgi:hypothetical protein